jgi:trk system potassium uptake protein TrkH
MLRLLRTATPVQLLVLGFAVIVLVGAGLLALPVSSARGAWQPFVDCLFMASSAISTTGLVVVDIGTDLSLFGQLVMLVIIQVGGIGYMCFLPLVVIGLLGTRLSIGSRMLLRESMARPTWLDMVKFTRVILVTTAVVETIGAAVLAAWWSRTLPLGTAIYAGVFHSINAFCTAGMSIWSDSMTNIGSAAVPNVTLMLLELAGGIGFFVLYDIARKGKKVARGVHPRALSTHTRLAISATALLIIAGASAILLTEWRVGGMAVRDRLFTALFQAVSASTTTGFNTVDIAGLRAPALFAILVLMFIGASPNSTGGGIKTTTLGVMAAGMWSLFCGRADITLFRRRIPAGVLHAASSLTLAAVLWCVAVLGVLVIVEPAPFLDLLFEVTSAFGNVGLSLGVTAGLSTLSKAVLAATMFFGRLGPLAIGFSLIGRREAPPHHYAEDEIYVG